MALNYEGQNGVSISGNAMQSVTDGTTVTTDNNKIVRAEQFVFDGVHDNGFSVIEAESGKKIDRKLSIKTDGVQVSINPAT